MCPWSLTKYGSRISRRFLTSLMPYDLYERHAVVGQLLRDALRAAQPPVCVLDVGGRAELLERFTPYRVTSVNVDGSGDVAASGCAIPFADNSFSAVVSIDTLEHLPRENRRPFIRECLRVARRYVVIAAPFGGEGHRECEKRLDSLYRSVYGEPHMYLNEHIRYGLPDLAELDQVVHSLEGTSCQRFFAGDYVWQGKQFERAISGHRKRGLPARFWNLAQAVTTLALFHPIRLRGQPDAVANRFYLLIEKKRAGA